ncbi:uncharacterized protein LOC129582494 isoform X2 [Paramacrobiotus metropolitanus]|uniref:uncharacterized protein LOC129582494 isoform X2 n=1 Tax=Paramacrobiotus metropolitanus TaxID=2943436 RepID=UPI002445809F|nr:uncharacterized protein LOC129582494 isoform X2 [Paramacrobiotus metropolitanus]
MPILHNVFTIIGALIKLTFLSAAIVTIPQDAGAPGGLAVIPVNGTTITLQINLRNFSNDQGIDIDGRRCDLATQCDVTFYAYLDAAVWPGSANKSNLQLVHQSANNNLFTIDKILNYSVCAKSAQIPMLNLRVKVDDSDVLTRDDSIERFSCLIPEHAFPVADVEEENAVWSEDLHCVGKVHPLSKVRLTFRYRYFQAKPTTLCL